MTVDARAALDAAIDTIESSYEFMLAYAAQGRDQEGGPGPSIRKSLQAFDAALDGLAEHLAGAGSAADAPVTQAFEGFRAVAQRDAAAARAAIRLVLAVPSIGSQLIDNLNASIHIRALLTDVFLLDETLKSRGRPS